MNIGRSGLPPGEPRRGPYSRAGARTGVVSLLVALGLLVCAVAASPAAAEEAPEITATFSCTAVTITYSNFPAQPGFKAVEKINVDGTFVKAKAITFTGPSATDTVEVHIPPGHHHVDALVKVTGNELKVGRDIKAKFGVECEPEPSFSIVKLQRIGGKGAYVTTPLQGKVAQTVEYEMIVANTGNVPLTFTEFSDPKCDEGTITGGPKAPLPIEGKAAWFCKHVLTGADDVAGFYTNAATATADPG